MSHSTTSSPKNVADRIENWFDSVYSDFKGFFFGEHSSTSSPAPGATTSPTNAPTTAEVAIQTASNAVSEAPTLNGPQAAPSVATIALSPTVTTSPSATPAATSLRAHHTTPALSYPSATPSSSSPSAPASHSSSSINQQTLMFAALGGLIVILVYLLTPVVVRLLQFIVNATKLIFGRPSSFSKDSEMGLTSDTFNLTANVDHEDEREGLNKKAKLRILFYMLWYGETFDEARLRFVLRQFARNGIGPEGQPLDPKYVTFDPANGAAEQQ